MNKVEENERNVSVVDEQAFDDEVAEEFRRIKLEKHEANSDKSDLQKLPRIGGGVRQSPLKLTTEVGGQCSSTAMMGPTVKVVANLSIADRRRIIANIDTIQLSDGERRQEPLRLG